MKDLLHRILLFLARLVPESLRPFLGWVADLVGGLDIPDGDPKAQQLADLVADLVRDITSLMDLPDADARDKARLVLENRFTNAFNQLAGRGGI